MKNSKRVLCFVLVLVISLVLVGCGSSTSSENAGKNDTGKGDNQAWNDPSKPEDQTWSDPENYESQAWSDPENYDDQEWRDPENPGTETTEPDESDHAGMYRHEIDGIVFYTEHDVERWIGHQDGLGMTFDLEQMVKDIFGDENTLKANEATIIPLKDYEAAFMFNGSVVYLALYNRNLNGQTRMQAQEGFIPAIGVESTDIFDLGDGSAEYYKPYYFINGSYYCTEYEMIEIIVYACERWARGEYYLFENFNGSTRLYISDGGTPRNP